MITVLVQCFGKYLHTEHKAGGKSLVMQVFSQNTKYWTNQTEKKTAFGEKFNSSWGGMNLCTKSYSNSSDSCLDISLKPTNSSSR